MPAADPTRRFSSRVGNYVRYRPGYPEGIVDMLRKECGLTSSTVIADVASGTGIFTRVLLENGNRVFGVEPNAEMRKAGEEFLNAYPRFSSIEGTAEETTLPDHTVDLVTAAQAAHWFDRRKARQEFIRILKTGGWSVLIWNERRIDSTPFLRDFERLLLRYGTDYETVRHERTTQEIENFLRLPHFSPVLLTICRNSTIQRSKDDFCRLPNTPQSDDVGRTDRCCRSCGRYLTRVKKTDK